jgi:hypothetical protein
MPTNQDLIEELMEYIKKHYELINEEFIIENNNAQDKMPQLAKLNFEEVMMELKEYIGNKRNRITFLNLLEKYKEQKNMSDSEIYGKAWIDRRHYFKIKNERLYHPTKKTIIALGMALKLDKNQMNELLSSCGYILSYQSIVDLVVMFCMEKGIYNIFDINALLIEVKQDVLVKE